MTKKDLRKLFNPNSLAVLGASRNEEKIGHIVLKNIINFGFKGRIFPVNPNCDRIENLKCYANYNDLPIIPDLAIIAIPGEAAVDMLEAIAKKGTRNVVIFSAGFKETGPKGAILEDKLKSLADQLQLSILGPNCLGFVSNISKINATFSRAGDLAGNLRFVAQSGALASAIFDWAKYYQLGFSEFITLGNKTIIDENDVLEYWLTNNRVKIGKNYSKYNPVGMYLESVNNGRSFLKLVSKICQNDPVFILKSGRSKEAQKAIQSHTGAMADDDAVLDALFEQAGVIRCEGVEDMLDLARVFSWENSPEGPNVAIVSNAGGPAVISTDILRSHDLKLANFAAGTQSELRRKLPSAANTSNPVDVLGDALSDRYTSAINCVLTDKNVDAVIVILTPQVMTEVEATAESIGRLAMKYNKPIVCSFMGASSVSEGLEILNKYKIPSFRFPERATWVLSKMWKWRQWQKLNKGRITFASYQGKPISQIGTIIRTAQSEKRTVLSALEATKILDLFKFKIPQTAKVSSLGEATRFASEREWPVVLKISSPNLLHKTDKNGVFLNIDSQNKMVSAWTDLMKIISKLPIKSNAEIMAQEQIIGGLEVIAGVKNDRSFGKVLMFGAGGVLTELIVDANIRSLPLTIPTIRELIEKSKVYPLLGGFRGRHSLAVNKLADIIFKLSQLAQDPNIEEIEINPIIVNEKNAYAVDGRVILKS